VAELYFTGAMNQLATAIRNCTACKLCTERTGNAEPAVVGSQYIEGGLALWSDLPLTKRDSNYLNGLLTQAGIDKDSVLWLSRLRCRPPRNRIMDYPDAVIACDQWSSKELEAYNPSVVILSGNTAMRAVFGVQANITSVRGTVRATSSGYVYHSRRWVPTFHPAAAMRNPELAQYIVDDMRLAKELL
jgi:uracil-DNA glycosylase family 4